MECNNKLYLTSDESDLLDTYYRYQISIIKISSICKKGTNITILDNLESFCEELLFDAQLMIKIIGHLLSCRSGVDKTGKYYLQGIFTIMEIKHIIYKEIIQKYILCVKCHKPEVNLKYKNDKIKQQCRACGSNTYLEKCNEDIVKIFRGAD
jgi:translation initiation factor 2 beta subunit (eIF-2beta)/eIF-5